MDIIPLLFVHGQLPIVAYLCPMIRLASPTHDAAVRRMWERCFNDSPAFTDLYFRLKYRASNTLLYIDGDTPAASVQMLPYRFSFFGTEVECAYLSGVCTLPEYRNRGIMGRLLGEALALMRQRGVALSVLIPAEEWLYGYYARYGYARVFEAGGEPQSLEALHTLYTQHPAEAYARFDAVYRTQDFRMQKTPDDFRAIMEDARLEGFPPRTDLPGMARVIHTNRLLEAMAARHPECTLAFRLDDRNLPSNNGRYEVTGGTVRILPDTSDTIPVLDAGTLCRLLLAPAPGNDPHTALAFPPHAAPRMNLMLE